MIITRNLYSDVFHVFVFLFHKMLLHLLDIFFKQVQYKEAEASGQHESSYVDTPSTPKVSRSCSFPSFMQQTFYMATYPIGVLLIEAWTLVSVGRGCSKI